jgi:hypothetical protein
MQESSPIQPVASPLSPRAVSIVTVAYDSYFFARLLVERVRALVGRRPYEIIVVDRGSRDGTRAWMKSQPDVLLVTKRQWGREHRHGEAAEAGIRRARHPVIVLMDPDAHPLEADWLERTADRLDERCRLTGAEFRDKHRGNPHGWYVHPHFMVFWREDVGHNVILRKMRGHDTDTGEEATIRMLAAGFDVRGFPIEFCRAFDVGHPVYPTVSAGVFHAWYSTRLFKEAPTVARETGNVITLENYLTPLMTRLRAQYGLDY